MKSFKRIIRSEDIKAQFTLGVKSRTRERILLLILVNCSLYAGESARGVPNLLVKQGKDTLVRSFVSSVDLALKYVFQCGVRICF